MIVFVKKALAKRQMAVSVLHARVQGCSSRPRANTAGNRRSFLEASRGKDFVEQGLVAINIGPRRLAPKALAAEKASKADQREVKVDGWPQRSRHSTGPAPSEEASELGGLGRSVAPWYWRWCRRAAPLASRGVVTTPARAREAFDTAAHAVEDHCGIASNLGKTRVLAAEGGPPPPGITELGEDVWCGDKPPAQRGVVVLGTPVGHPDFVQAWTD
ncbi:unnamed protein product, partial [Symbiodinium sp. KB8]